MKAFVAIVGFLLCLSCAFGAPPTREEVSAAISQMESKFVSGKSVDAAKVVIEFAEHSKDVRSVIDTNTVPWLQEKWGLKADLEQTIRSMLLAAYIAGNTKSQLAAGKPIDDPYEGWLFVCRGYKEFRAKVSFSSPSIESLDKKRKQGTLKQHALDVLKKAETETKVSPSNGSQTNRTSAPDDSSH